MSRREILLRSTEVGVLSILMGAILASVWRDDIYAEATNVEEMLLREIPAISSGGIQVASMFGLGLFFTWALLYAQDIRKHLQGYIILVGSVLALGMMAWFDTFLPQMEPTIQNGAALICGVGIGLASEMFETRFHDQTPALLELDLKKSRFGHAVRKDGSGSDAEFPVAARGLYMLVVSIVVVANVALIAAAADPAIIAATLVVGGLFGWRFHKLIYLDDPPQKDHDVEIIGPRGSGKTLFLYGLYLTVNTDDTKFELGKPNQKWSDQTIEIRTNKTEENPWGATSTNHPVYYEFEFTSVEGFYERIKISLTDFPGGWVDTLSYRLEQEQSGTSSSEAVATDGGTTDDGQWAVDEVETHTEDDPLLKIDGVGPSTAEQLRKEGYESEADLESTSSSDLADIDGIGEGTAARIKSYVGENESQGGWMVDQEEESEDDEGRVVNKNIENVDGLRSELQDAETILVLVDSKAAVEQGLVALESDSLKGMEPDETKTESETKVAEMIQILEDADPNRVIVVATKADFLIPAYMSEENPDDPPHEELGDFEHFSDWVDEKFDVPPFTELKARGEVSDTVHPVYYQSERRETDDAVVPDLENGLLQPEGYDLVIEDVVEK